MNSTSSIENNYQSLIAENIHTVQEQINRACACSNRNPASVTLMAVSKTKPGEMILTAKSAGIQVFGENYVQELCEKINSLPADITWHMIGHLQRNKVKYIVGKTALIHSVDSFRLAEQIEKEAAKAGIVQDILLEINVAEEENKWGFSIGEAESAVRQIAPLSHLHIRGLMTSAPYTENPEENRIYFRSLRKCFEEIQTLSIPNVSMDILSMGMTGDYQVAVEEGATLVRVGTGIFGVRNYNESVVNGHADMSLYH